MKDIRKIISDLLYKGRLMQIASTSHNKPWICTVYYVADDQLNLYWLSHPDRRHSRELLANPDAAIAVAIKPDRPVIGLQAEGKVEQINDSDKVRFISDKYYEKYQEGENFYDNFLTGSNQHVMYRFVPKSYVLFDELHFPSEGRQELKI